MLRERFNDLWRSVDFSSRRKLSRSAQEFFANFSPFIKSDEVLAYSPIANLEIDFINDLRDVFPAKNYYFPKIVGEQLEFYRSYSRDDFELNDWRILEPTSNTSWIYHSELNTILIVPCVAVDSSGNRLGRGKGFYDRFLSNISDKNNILKLCVAPYFAVYDQQLPCDKWDVAMDTIVELDFHSANLLK